MPPRPPSSTDATDVFNEQSLIYLFACAREDFISARGDTFSAKRTISFAEFIIWICGEAAKRASAPPAVAAVEDPSLKSHAQSAATADTVAAAPVAAAASSPLARPHASPPAPPPAPAIPTAPAYSTRACEAFDYIVPRMYSITKAALDSGPTPGSNLSRPWSRSPSISAGTS